MFTGSLITLVSYITSPPKVIPTQPDGGNHTKLFADAAATKEAHEATLPIMKALAITGSRVLTDESFVAQVRFLSPWKNLNRRLISASPWSDQEELQGRTNNILVS